MVVALISFASAILGVLLAPLLQDFIQARQEIRARRRILWERDVKRLDELEIVLSDLVYASGVFTHVPEDAQKIEQIGDDALKKLRFFELGLPGYEGAHKHITDVFVLYTRATFSYEKNSSEGPSSVPETLDEEDEAYVELFRLSRQILSEYRRILSHNEAVNGSSEATFNSLWQQIRLRFPWNMERSERS